MRKKLIEVALPLEAINEASRKEKNPFTKNHPRALHVWWARRPLAACRAVLFSSLVDDPSSHPEKFPTEEAQKIERDRLFDIIEELVKWENSNNLSLLEKVKKEIEKCTGENPPPCWDPFCGGGSIPLEAQRLGLKAYASDLNPIAVLITKALIEIPPKFAGKPPVNPESRKGTAHTGEWPEIKGLAKDVRYYGGWIRNEAEKRISHLYPKVKLPKDQGGWEATVLAYFWTRIVKCLNPACGGIMPLVRSFLLSTKKGKEAWVEPTVNRQEKTVSFEVRTGKGMAHEGTVNRRGAKCIICDQPVPFDHIRSEGKANRIGSQLMAIVTESINGRTYFSPSEEQTVIIKKIEPAWKPEENLPHNPRDFKTPNYGMKTFADLFTPRQLTALNTFSDLVGEAWEQVKKDALTTGLPDKDAIIYADAVATYLGLAVSRFADFSNSICSWDSGNTNMRQLFARQAIPMTWDFTETNPLSGVVNLDSAINWTVSAIENISYANKFGLAKQIDSISASNIVKNALISTDPPYYDNIGYADLSDFFYVWLRRSLSKVYPDLLSTMLTPKNQELIATPYRFNGDKKKAEEHFLTGLSKAFQQMRENAHPDYPVTVYYAFKQTEEDEDEENGKAVIASTGWETMLEGLLKANFAITGTWPMRTEQQQRSIAAGTNALASSIVLVCRSRPADAPMTTRREFIYALKQELPEALKKLKQGYIAPVDLAQAVIGPGMAVFSRYSKVVEADGSPMKIRTALGIINQVLDEYLTEQEEEYDADTRWALAWFEQFGHQEGAFGIAETLSKAKNTSISGMVEAGILEAKAGKVRLLNREELSPDWNPLEEKRLTVWETTQHLICILEKDGERGAANLLSKIGAMGEVARDLAYRLYNLCDRKGWSSEALPYNSVVVAWPEIVKLASSKPSGVQESLV